MNNYYNYRVEIEKKKERKIDENKHSPEQS